MTLPSDINERNYGKYRDTTDGPAVAVVNKDGSDIGGVVASNNVDGGSVTIGTSEVEITFTGTTESILIQADQSNTDFIYIGKTGVLTDGTNVIAKLDAGDVLELSYNDSDNALYAISGTASQTIYKGALI